RQNRAAHGSTKLVAFDAVALDRKCIPGIETAIAHELKRVTMKLVRSLLRNQAHRTGAFDPGLDAGSAGFDLEFLQRIGKGHGLIGTVERINVISPVQRVIQATVYSPSDGNIALTEWIAATRAIDQGRGICGGRQGN